MDPVFSYIGMPFFVSYFAHHLMKIIGILYWSIKYLILVRSQSLKKVKNYYFIDFCIKFAWVNQIHKCYI